MSLHSFRTTCRIQIDAQSGGGALTHVNPLIVKGVLEAMRLQAGGMVGAFAWPSLIRKLGKLGDSYTT